VRNLARRSAEAARETAEKIEGAIAKTGQGVAISERVSKSLTEIAEKVRQVDELVTAVAESSREQSQGVHQINTAVSSMDQVVQGNAASAEESASASEELNAQAEALKESIIHLQDLVGETSITHVSVQDRPGENRPRRIGHPAPVEATPLAAVE